MEVNSEIEKDENKQKSKSEPKPKSERIFVKSNKGKKIELKNLDQIESAIQSGIIEPWTLERILLIKNQTFKNNVIDVGAQPHPMIVSSIRFVKTSKLGRKLTPMVWEYYKNRGNLDVNQVINQYGRNNLVINYSLNPLSLKKKSPQIELELETELETELELELELEKVKHDDLTKDVENSNA